MNQPITTPFRVLLAIKDERIRIPIEGLLKTVKAKQYSGETVDAVLTYLNTPEGIDFVIVDEAWSELSIEVVRRVSTSRPGAGDSYLVALINGSDLGAALHAFNAGADAVLRKPIDPLEFLNACRAAERVADSGKQFSTLEKNVEVQAEKQDRLEKELKAIKEAKAAQAAKDAPSDQETPATSQPLAEVEETAAPDDSPRSRSRGVLLTGGDDSIGGFTLVEQLQESIRESFLELGIPEKNCASRITTGAAAHLAFVGWQGAFCPASRQWVDLLFCFSWASIESLSQRISGKKASGDVEGIATVGSYMGNLQSTYKRLFRRVDNPNSVLLAQPWAFLRVDWMGEAGLPDESRTYQPGDGEMIANFHIAPGTFATKLFLDIKSGDVLAESVAQPNQQRIPLISRGGVLTTERLKKIEDKVEPGRNFWVVEPSLLARRLGNEIVGER